jgi:D-beta-D-heptose 7-phosphate kinase/D-beta-D-heptose 1-phosphate adenosyltransferase
MPTSIARARLETLLAAAAGQRVAIVGDAMLDVYLRGDVERISPEAPVPVVRVRERKDALGGAANVAQNVAALGAGCALVAAVGSDLAGTRLREMLLAIGADAEALVPTERPTTTKTRVLARAQQVVRFDEEEDADLTPADVERVLDAIARSLKGATAVVLEDYNKGVLVPRVIVETIRMATERGLPVIVDPKYRNFFDYRGATVFKPNRRELEAALGAAVDLAHPEALPTTLARLGVEHLLLTLGEQGMALISADGTSVRVPTTAREVYDVVGAGDTVTAYLAVMLGAGATAVEAAVIANFAAGVEVAKLGAATVSADEVLEAYDHFAASDGAIPVG